MSESAKYEILNSKQMQNSKKYDLEDRTLKFSKNVIDFINLLPKTLVNIEITKQLIRASTSIGANYIEANESLGRKDFVMKIKISRKEAKETIYWLKLIEIKSMNNKETRNLLLKEATELMKIFGSIVEKSKLKI